MGPKSESRAALFYRVSLDDQVPQYHLLRLIFPEFLTPSLCLFHLAKGRSECP